MSVDLSIFDDIEDFTIRKISIDDLFYPDGVYLDDLKECTSPLAYPTFYYHIRKLINYANIQDIPKKDVICLMKYVRYREQPFKLSYKNLMDDIPTIASDIHFWMNHNGTGEYIGFLLTEIISNFIEVNYNVEFYVPKSFITYNHIDNLYLLKSRKVSDNISTIKSWINGI